MIATRPLMAAAVIIASVASGCAPVVMPVGEPAPPGGAIGPQLVVAVANRSDRDVAVGYEFEAPSSGGGGEGLVARCELQEVMFGEVAGRYQVIVDREAAFDGVVPPGGPADGFLVVRLIVEPDGAVRLDGQPAWTRIPPALVNRPLAGCG